MEKINLINQTILPKVLSDMEFDYYFYQFKNGSRSALDILVKHNLKLVYWYIDSNIECTGEEYKEIFSVGSEALLEAFYKFDFSRDVKFSSFATSCIRNKILKYFRSESKHKKVMSLDVPMSDSDDSDTFADTLIDDGISLEDEILEKDLSDFRKRIINEEIMLLNDIDREIIRMYFGFCDGKLYGQSEIAKTLGFSQSQISKRLSRTLKRIKNRIELAEQEDIRVGMKLTKKVA